MSTPTRDAIESFKSITGESESVALRKLEEYGGNLNAAVSAHFLELERSITNPITTASSRYGSVDVNNQSGFGTRGIFPLISAVRRFKPSLLLDPNYRRNLLNQTGAPNFNPQATSPHMGEVTGVPVGFNSGNEHPLYSGARPSITYSPGTPSYYGEGVYNNVSRDGHQQIDGVESEMMQAAIEASKKEFEQTYMNERRGSSKGSSSIEFQQRQLEQEDNELARAISLSLKKELDEAIMLETQLFSQIAEGSSRLPCHEQGGLGRSINPGLQAVSHPQSSSLMDQRLLRQQQDEEYLISLLADKEKETNALKKAENHSLKEEESFRRKPEGEGINKVMTTEMVSLPPEPARDDENAITILIRMPDGTRHGRRFCRSDNLQLLFDFIDVGKVAKPGTYRLVRPYPRDAYGAADCSLSLNQLGLTGKQEALFLEFV